MNPQLSLTVPCHSGAAYNADPNWSHFRNSEEDCAAASTPEPSAVKISTGDRSITIEGCIGDRVRIFDTGGRLIAETTCQGTCSLHLPAAGVYMVQIADSPARKIVLQ